MTAFLKKVEASVKLSLAYSPCPNDTFIFHDLALGGQLVCNHEIEVHLHDIEELNRLALEKRYDVTKLSFPAWLQVQGEYRLLGAGAALGFGCGPLLVSRRPISKHEVSSLRVAIPGEFTTAHLLFRLWCPEARNKVFAPYHHMMGLVAEGEVDCAVVIHESRFVYQEAGLLKVVDLGEWYEEMTSLPVPLAGIGIRRGISAEVGAELEDRIRTGIMNSRSNMERVLPYIKQHAQEMSDDVLMKHISTFVTEQSMDMGDLGAKAIAKLAELAGKGIISRMVLSDNLESGS